MEITNNAKTALQDLMHQHTVQHVRIAYEGMGCCSPQIGLGLNEPLEKDHVQIINGISVAVDPRVQETVEALQLDVQPSENGQAQFIMSGLPDTQC